MWRGQHHRVLSTSSSCDRRGTQDCPAQAHDVKREAATNSAPQGDDVDEFDDDLEKDNRNR